MYGSAVEKHSDMIEAEYLGLRMYLTDKTRRHEKYTARQNPLMRGNSRLMFGLLVFPNLFLGAMRRQIELNLSPNGDNLNQYCSRRSNGPLGILSVARPRKARGV